WKIVPAVTEVCRPHAAQCQSRPPPAGHAFPPPHLGQRKPSRHRSWARYNRQASAVANRRSNSPRSRGKSSTGRNTIYWGYFSQVNSQPSGSSQVSVTFTFTTDCAFEAHVTHEHPVHAQSRVHR